MAVVAGCGRRRALVALAVRACRGAAARRRRLAVVSHAHLGGRGSGGQVPEGDGVLGLGRRGGVVIAVHMGGGAGPEASGAGGVWALGLGAVVGLLVVGGRGRRGVVVSGVVGLLLVLALLLEVLGLGRGGGLLAVLGSVGLGHVDADVRKSAGDGGLSG